MNIEHRHIEIFRAIMRAGSVTGAAALLHTSQPTVSRDLARLEQQLGFALFDRLRGRLRATARAQLLYEEVQRSWLGLEQVLATARGLRESTAGPLAVACVPAFAQSLLPAACARFQAAHAEAGVCITPQESPLLEDWLSAQRFDLGLTEQDSAPPGCTQETLLVANEVCVLPAGHPLLARSVLDANDFAQERFISLAADDPYRQMLDALFSQRSVTRRLQIETRTAASVCQLVREGLGVAVVNPLSALEYADAGLHWRPLAFEIPYRISLVRPAYRSPSPLADAFASALHEASEHLLQRLT